MAIPRDSLRRCGQVLKYETREFRGGFLALLRGQGNVCGWWTSLDGFCFRVYDYWCCCVCLSLSRICAPIPGTSMNVSCDVPLRIAKGSYDAQMIRLYVPEAQRRISECFEHDSVSLVALRALTLPSRTRRGFLKLTTKLSPAADP